MRRIALFGGSFDPIHFGHIKLANFAMDTACADRLLLIPAKVSPFKTEDKPTDDCHRLNMCRLACKYIGGAEVSEIEFSLPSPSYTVNTLNALTEQFPDEKFIFICGADSFMTLQKWKSPKRIFELCEIFTAARDDFSLMQLMVQKQALESIGAKITLMKMPKIDISSTTVRNMIKNGEDAKDLLPIEISDYIKQHNLYL